MNRASPTRRAYIEPAKAVGYLPIVDFSTIWPLPDFKLAPATFGAC